MSFLPDNGLAALFVVDMLKVLLVIFVLIMIMLLLSYAAYCVIFVTAGWLVATEIIPYLSVPLPT